MELLPPTAYKSDGVDRRNDSNRLLTFFNRRRYRLLSNVRPLYAVPSWKYFAEKVIPEMFYTIKVQLTKDIHPDGNTSTFPLSFTTDIWTRDSGEDSFISWTAYCINPTREEHLLHVCPFAGSHTAIAISDMIAKLLKSWKVPTRPEYTLSCVTTLPTW